MHAKCASRFLPDTRNAPTALQRGDSQPIVRNSDFLTKIACLHDEDVHRKCANTVKLLFGLKMSGF